MIDTINHLKSGNLDQIDNGKLYPVNRWMSGDVNNLDTCKDIAQTLWKLPPNIQFKRLHKHLKKFDYIKYPRPKKYDNKKLDVLKPYIKRIMKWSERDFNHNKHLVIQRMEMFNEHLNKIVGFDKRECKILGLKYDVPKVKKEKPKPQGLSRWA